MGIALRDYQTDCVETVFSKFRSGINRQLAHLPTGSGKTIIMAAIAKAKNCSTLILAHREELIDQARGRILDYWPEADIGICMGDRQELDHQIIIGSVQSCSRQKRLELLQGLGIELLMIDEAHHAASDSYVAVVKALGFEKGADRLLVGVTATPERGDEVGLGVVFDELVFTRSISTMIKMGHLSGVRGLKLLTNINTGKVATTQGDYAVSQLAAALNVPERNAFIVAKFKEHAADRKAVVFCIDVKHCQDLAEALRVSGIAAQAVWGSMDPQDRKSALEGLKTGRIQVATSCGVLCEGWDEPSITCVVMARPTKSRPLYIQCVGRGLRRHPGKENCLVLDFSDSSHSLESAVTLTDAMPELAPKETRSGMERGRQQAPAAIGFREVYLECDLLGSKRFIWIDAGNGEWCIQNGAQGEIWLLPEGDGYVARLYWQRRHWHRLPGFERPVSVEYAVGIAEDYIRQHLSSHLADPKAEWINANVPATPKQAGLLEKFGFEKSRVQMLTKGAASMEISKCLVSESRSTLHSIAEASDAEYASHLQLVSKANKNNLTGGTSWKRSTPRRSATRF